MQSQKQIAFEIDHYKGVRRWLYLSQEESENWHMMKELLVRIVSVDEIGIFGVMTDDSRCQVTVCSRAAQDYGHRPVKATQVGLSICWLLKLRNPITETASFKILLQDA